MVAEFSLPIGCPGPRSLEALSIMSQPRVVSLLPAATEILCLIGGRSMLVGRSHECDFPGPGSPASVLDLPILTAARVFDAAQHSGPVDSGAIDRQVRELTAAGQPLYTLNEALLTSLRPDVILTQDLCDVCSIDLATVRAIAQRMNPKPRIVSLNPQTLEGVIDDVLTVGEAVGLDDAARHATVAFRERLFRATDYVNPFADGPSVGFLEWTDPLFVAGHWNVQLIERAGGFHPLNASVADASDGAAAGPMASLRRAGKSIRVPAEVFAATRPEFIVIAPCGLNLVQTRAAAADLARQSWWGSLPAVKRGRVALVDGNQMFNRPGPRLVDAFEFLVGLLNDRPDVIPAGFPWERIIS